MNKGRQVKIFIITRSSKLTTRNFSPMAGIYIHIPFCKQACHYCNFHFTTSLRNKDELVAALVKEMELRKDYLKGETVETIYFGGGTPSLLEIADLRLQIDRIRSLYTVAVDVEITLEANPDDITEEKLQDWKEAGINRLSIGVQSFFEDDLLWMNRAHNAEQAIGNLQLAKKYFSNITADLIYGTPGLSNEKWKQNVDTMMASGIPHLSCYALTVEPKTPLHKMIREHRSADINPDIQSEQFLLLMQWMEKAGYEHYEISNFAKPASPAGRPGFRSRHNSAYWAGTSYLGLGPSAHSFDGKSRQWNISNNQVYMESISNNKVPFEKEILTETQKLNEYIMTSLRTMEGLDLCKVSESASHELRAASRTYIERGLIKLERNSLILTQEGKLLADGIASDLFV
jgi:oxygen-independent coproporphyrinogen-3 oxidase